MLTEYALTPHLFDDLHNAQNEEWLERLRRFGERLLPVDPTRACNTVVSDLCDGTWYASAFRDLIRDLERRQREETNKRLPALDLLKALQPRLEKCLVKRPFCSSQLPDTEEGWASEAESSAVRSRVPMHRLVGSDRLSPGDGRYTLYETRDEVFWDTVHMVQPIAADVDQQLLALRRMCIFYTFFAFASPHLSADGTGKDLTFAVRLAKSLFQRPADFQPAIRIDLHAEGLTAGESQRDQQAQRILDRVADELGPAIRMVRLFLWRTIRERRFLVGDSDGSDSRPQVRWAVTMTHVARPDSDDPKQDRHTFSLQDRHETSRLSSEFYSNTARQCYPGSPYKATG